MLRRLFSFFRRPPAPVRFDCRAQGNSAAVVFVHGFSGRAYDTWADMIPLLLQEAAIQNWDVFGLGYPSSLRIDVPHVWSADPDLDVAARTLRSTLGLAPFRGYKALAIVAHSMGGLLVQRALIDDFELRTRVTHVALFGTPSAGLEKTRLFTRLKRQFRDMTPNGAFIKTLRRDWKRQFGEKPVFHFRAVAGDRDEFVPAASSLAPFPDELREVVPGNHLQMIRPTNRDHQSCQLLLKLLTGRGGKRSIVDSARLAVEMGEFQTAVNALLPQASHIDDAAIVSLALALEELGRSNEALDLLERHYRGGTSSTDAIGVLAGRLKRKWLAERRVKDLQRARELYSEALSEAEKIGDRDQAYYHAINVAFLDVMAATPPGTVSESIRSMAQQALQHCAASRDSSWRSATFGEAHLILGDLTTAAEKYRDAVRKTNSPRELYSMYSQAIRLAVRLYGETGGAEIEAAFNLSAP
jgi:pimeloyl-ACP methyl ester carboxylesterase